MAATLFREELAPLHSSHRSISTSRRVGPYLSPRNCAPQKIDMSNCVSVNLVLEEPFRSPVSHPRERRLRRRISSFAWSMLRQSNLRQSLSLRLRQKEKRRKPQQPA